MSESGEKRRAAEEPDAKRRRRYFLNVEDIMSDNLTPVANAYWAGPKETLKPFNAQIIVEIYKRELVQPDPTTRLVLLELSGFLEKYLWPHFDHETSSFAHCMSIIMMVNEKFRQNLLEVWESFHARGDVFKQFFDRVLTLREQPMQMIEKTQYLVFLVHAFQSLEDEIVRGCCLKLTSLPLWATLTPAMLKKQMKAFPEFKKHAKTIKAMRKKQAKSVATTFVPALMDDFHALLNSITPSSNFDHPDMKAKLEFLERFLEFVVDLLAQLPTRRFFKAVAIDRHFMVLCELSHLNKMAMASPDHPGKLFNQLLGNLKYYIDFEIEDDGHALTDAEMLERHYAKVGVLQRTAFAKHRATLCDLAALNVSAIDTREALMEYLAPLDAAELRRLCEELGLLHEAVEQGKAESLAEETKLPAGTETKALLLEILISFHVRRQSQQRSVSALPLFPTEEILWDQNLVPSEDYTGGVLSLPKLNLQFLTFHDYLLRNFHLYRLESTYEIREDIAQALIKLRPRLSNSKQETVFTGWARYALPIYSFSVTAVKKPNIGETKPALVKAEVTLDLSPFNSKVREEWEQIRKHDVFFLLTVRGQKAVSGADKLERYDPHNPPSREELGVEFVRGCEVVRVLDEDKKAVGEYDDDGHLHVGVGNMRTYQVELDTAQYQADMASTITSKNNDCYTTFNLLMRRDPKENNFKAVLRTIRDLMAKGTSVPKWLHDVFLGYGNPSAAQYHNLPTQLKTCRFFDTFVSKEHLEDSFPNPIEWKPEDKLPGTHANLPPTGEFELAFPLGEAPHINLLKTLQPRRRQAEGAEASASTEPAADVAVAGQAPGVVPIAAKPWRRPPLWAPTQRKRNTVHFTPMQVEAIKSGVNHGLTMVVGPPGTGKTDTAVQTIAEIYNNFPDQRMLIVTHSNHALNDLFEKLLERDIDERYLVRLGRGQDFLETDKDFSRFGRVNHMLAHRMELLEEVSVLSTSFDMGDDAGYTCETAGHFFLFHVMARWESFLLKVKAQKAANDIAEAHEAALPEDMRKAVEAVRQTRADQLAADKELLKVYQAKQAVLDRKAIAKKGGAKVVSMDEEEEEEDDDTSKPPSQVYHEDLLIALRRKIAKQEEEDVVPSAKLVSKHFPFKTYFEEKLPSGEDKLFLERSYDEDMFTAESCLRSLEKLFHELAECKPFELLRTGKDRGSYLLTKHAKIIAMTCTHAAIKRGDFMDLGFQYDNLVMEESAQILDIETFIPMVLQADDPEFGNRLKRIVLLGDHNQLPPVIKNQAFQKFCHMDQSLFTRLVRLGLPYIQLNAQGRMRPTLADLWNWKYDGLQNLPNTISGRFLCANAGLQHEFQLINVEDYEGQGESTPQPFFYQNLGEAEYLVQLFMYLRLIGTPADKISIITTYNGQKALIRDVLAARCANNPLYGLCKVTTVDKFQGQQNDFILLSLVRTRSAGHLRDIRRLVVAMSRARLGLYVFCRASLFRNCYELTRTFNVLLSRPTELVLLPEERTLDGVNPHRAVTATGANPKVIKDVGEMGQLVVKLQAQIEGEHALYYQRVWEYEESQRKKAEEADRIRREAKRLRDEAAMEEARAAKKEKVLENKQEKQKELDEDLSMDAPRPAVEEITVDEPEEPEQPEEE